MSVVSSGGCDPLALVETIPPRVIDPNACLYEENGVNVVSSPTKTAGRSPKKPRKSVRATSSPYHLSEDFITSNQEMDGAIESSVKKGKRKTPAPKRPPKPKEPKEPKMPRQTKTVRKRPAKLVVTENATSTTNSSKSAHYLSQQQHQYQQQLHEDSNIDPVGSTSVPSSSTMPTPITLPSTSIRLFQRTERRPSTSSQSAVVGQVTSTNQQPENKLFVDKVVTSTSAGVGMNKKPDPEHTLELFIQPNEFRMHDFPVRMVSYVFFTLIFIILE
jgi:hypothetical protein